MSSLLTLSVLLTQSAAAFAHAHACPHLLGHDPRPHFHANLSAPGGHHHGPDGHCHDADEGDLPDPVDRPLACPPPPPGHDADAVFVSAVDAVAPERLARNDGSAPLPPWGISARPADDSPPRILPGGVVGVRHFPPAGHGPCPIYVRHLALLL